MILPRLVGVQYATAAEESYSSRKIEETEPKRKNTTQLWMWLVLEVKSDAVKNSIA